MDEQCKAALDLLVQNGYLEIVKGKYRPTKKLNDQKPVTPEVMVVRAGETFTGTWEELYVRFIADCKVPFRGESGDGTMYSLNKYSDEAMKKFKELIKLGFVYDLLVQVTASYYKGSTRYKKTITNYIVEGLWRADYLTLKDQDPKQQIETLKQQIDAAKPFTRDRIG